MRYSTLINLDAGVGTTAVHVFRASSLFDPDFTGTGDQPRGLDQLMLLFDHYLVIGAKITIHGVGLDTVGSIIGIALSDDSTSQTGLGYQESRNRVYRVTSSQQPTTLSKTYSCKKFLGVSHPLGNKDFSGTITTNPLENAFFHIYYFSNNVLTNPALTSFCVNIEFSVIFTEPVNPAQS